MIPDGSLAVKVRIKERVSSLDCLQADEWRGGTLGAIRRAQGSGLYCSFIGEDLLREIRVDESAAMLVSSSQKMNELKKKGSQERVGMGL